MGMCAGWGCLWLFLVAAAAQEPYQERYTLDNEETPFYQDDNVLDIGSIASYKGPGNDIAKDMLLYNFIQSLQPDPSRNRPKYSPYWFPTLDMQEDVHLQNNPYFSSSPEDEVSKGFGETLQRIDRPFKRLAKPKPTPRPKHKKGHRIVRCYLKLCAFYK